MPARVITILAVDPVEQSLEFLGESRGAPHGGAIIAVYFEGNLAHGLAYVSGCQGPMNMSNTGDGIEDLERCRPPLSDEANDLQVSRVD